MNPMLGALAAGCAAMVGCSAAFQSDFIYYPSAELKTPTEAGLPDMRAVEVVTEDHLVMTGWYAPPRKGSRLTVVYFHGNGGALVHRAYKARAFLNTGVGVLLVGYRGYGGNPGRPSETGLYADARAALTWLKSLDVTEQNIVLYGESLGTGVAIQMATEFPAVDSLILEAPYTRLPDLAPLPPGVADMLMTDRYDSKSKMLRVKAPLLILHGEQDGVIPVSMGRELEVLAKTRSGLASVDAAFIPGAGHNDLWDGPGADIIFKFIAHREGR